MFARLKSWLFKQDSGTEETDHVWNAMESMDSRNSLTRLRQLNLSKQQFPVVKGLLDGTISPADRPGVPEWCESQSVSSTGMDALAYALQLALESNGTTYVFPKGEPGPAAMIPKLADTRELTVVVCHIGGTPVVISSLAEFLSSHGIEDYSCEVLTPARFRRRVTGVPDFAREPLDRGVTPSVTIAKRADEQQYLLEPFEMSDLAEAINRELNLELTSDKITLEVDRIEKLGLYTCVAQVDSITQKKVHFWIVPALESDSSNEG